LENTHAKGKIYWGFYQHIVFIAHEGRHIRM